ncbi:hypothetical protein C7212DRAFT_340392 [Tuber magnatum]|uniref:Uncharacterized protein n=1 Tax=Tuber magnatum TaxID=42249 RepID=A0A317SZI1_9PEZI|nr:hypothetical protein C7212DRAFT_340392 [Tuber magnatum]
MTLIQTARRPSVRYDFDLQEFPDRPTSPAGPFRFRLRTTSIRRLVCSRTPGHENDGNVYWCKRVSLFPSPATYGPEYSTWRTTAKHNMERKQIFGYRDATPAQWAAIQAYALTVESIASNGMSPHWGVNTARGRLFTKCLNFLLKDIAKKHSRMLTSLGLVVAPTPPPAITATAATAGNDCKPPQTVRDRLVLRVHALSAFGRVVAHVVGYRHLIGTKRYGTILLLDNLEEPLPISEMIPILSSRHVRIWWGLSPPNEPMDFLFRCHRDPGDPGTPPPHGQPYGNRNNRGTPDKEEVEEQQEQEARWGEMGGRRRKMMRKRRGPGGEDNDEEDKDGDAVRRPVGEDDDDDDDFVRWPGRFVPATKQNTQRNKQKTRPPSQVKQASLYPADSNSHILSPSGRILAAVIGDRLKENSRTICLDGHQHPLRVQPSRKNKRQRTPPHQSHPETHQPQPAAQPPTPR